LDDLIGLSLWAMALGFYLLPTLVAWFQQHHQLYAVAALNLLLGWTLVGWIGALAWASMRQEPLPNRTKKKKRKKRAARIQPHHPVTHSHSDLARRLAELPPRLEV
jgi:T4 superinfection immunity protein